MPEQCRQNGGKTLEILVGWCWWSKCGSEGKERRRQTDTRGCREQPACFDCLFLKFRGGYRTVKTVPLGKSVK